jgi:hypothetical protein
MDRNLILKWIFKKVDVTDRTGINWLSTCRTLENTAVHLLIPQQDIWTHEVTLQVRSDISS